MNNDVYLLYNKDSKTQWYWKGYIDNAYKHLVETEKIIPVNNVIVSLDDFNKHLRDKSGTCVVIPNNFGGFVLNRNWNYEASFDAFLNNGNIVVFLWSALQLDIDGSKRVNYGYYHGFHHKDMKVVENITGVVDILPCGNDCICLGDILANKKRDFGNWKYELRIDYERIKNISDYKVLAWLGDPSNECPFIIGWFPDELNTPGMAFHTEIYFNASLSEEINSQIALDFESFLILALKKLETRTSNAWYFWREALPLANKLKHVSGKEKDYQKILSNDLDLLIDILQIDAIVNDEDYTNLLKYPEIINEPVYDVSKRLDFKLISNTTDCEVWIELENKGMDIAQLEQFIKWCINNDKKRNKCYLVSIDWEEDVSIINNFTEKTEKDSNGTIVFIHINLKDVINKLTRIYSEKLIAYERKRASLQIIQTLCGR